MIEAFIHGFLNQFQPLFLGMLTLAVIIGVLVGVLPAISGLSTMAILLGLVYGKDPAIALPFLLAMQSISVTGGSITAILVNIPGDAPNTATLIDGYPMSQKGEAGRAIGAALTASGLGGVLGVFMAFAFIPVIIPLVLALHMPEMFFMIAIGVCFIAVLGREDPLRGLISGGLGLLLSFVGFQANTAIPRFTFDMIYLLDGLKIIPVAMGLFAGAELLELAVSGQTIARVTGQATPWHQLRQGIADVFRHWWLFFRSAVIGYIVGVIPALGGGIAAFISYGQAKHTSRHPEKFGTGTVEGVIAPETANNAVSGGALLTTLAFGIPGSPAMALLLAALVLAGIKPGTAMLVQETQLSFTMLWAVALANIMAAAMCFLLCPYLVRLTTINPYYLVAPVLSVVYLTAFTVNETMLDLVCVLLFTGLGLVMKWLGYSRPAFFLGFVLGALFEKYFWFSLKMQGPLFFLRPISLGLIVLMIVLFTFRHIKSGFMRLIGRNPG